MRQQAFIAFAGAIALAAAGCTSEDTSVAPSPAAPSPVTQSPAPAAQPQTTTQPFAKPLVAQKPAGPGATVPGLIQSTNGDERARQVQANIAAQRGKKDPFAGLPPALPRTPTVASQVPNVPRLPNNPRRTAGTPFAPPRNTPLPPPSSPLPSRGTPAAPNNTPTIAALPPQPSTTLASSVEVTGVVNVGGRMQAIVKAPNEATSRYVSIGQRLSNGQVLVKRIDMTGSDPVVILEQNGVEVSKVVGEKAPSQQTT